MTKRKNDNLMGLKKRKPIRAGFIPLEFNHKNGK